MNSFRIRDQGSTDNVWNVQVALTTWSWANTNALICHPHRKRIPISFRMRKNAAYAHLAAGPNDTQRDFTPVSNQNFTKHVLAMKQPCSIMLLSGSPCGRVLRKLYHVGLGDD